MAHSSPSGSKPKPAKPRPDFPLFPHATGRWAKKIRGKLRYFGKWDDPQGALGKYIDQRDDLYAGRTPRVKGEGLSVRDLLNRFLTSKQKLLDSGEIRRKTFADYRRTCNRIAEGFGLDRLVVDLAADDFERLRADIATTWGPVRLGNEIQRVRMVFKYALDCRLIDAAVGFGPGFKKPSAKVLRLARNRRGPRMFAADEIRTMLDPAGVQLKAAILLGVNCGFGNHDLAMLPLAALDVDSIMGHAPHANDMAAVYRERIDDSRLVAVTEHVRRWLFAAETK